MLKRLVKGVPNQVEVNTNEFVMNIAKKAAQKRQLTLEMIYRAADRNNRGKVELEQLKIFMKNMRLGLTPA
jgi:hypothetical protein